MVIHKNLKIPLLMITFSTGFMSAMTVAFFKFHGEVLRSGEKGFFSLFELTMFAIAIGMSTMLLGMLNVGIQYYEQIDVAPTYQAFLTILKILTGLIVLNEIQFYTEKQLLIVSLCATLIVSGILINTRKSSIWNKPVIDSNEVVSDAHKPLLVSNDTCQELVELDKEASVHADDIIKLRNAFAN